MSLNLFFEDMILMQVFVYFTWSIFLLRRLSENVAGFRKLAELLWRDRSEAGEKQKTSVQLVEDEHDSFRLDA